ncbi:DUF6029 family protein [bacterium]|nr:DUF6029 family protein [bacterium]
MNRLAIFILLGIFLSQQSLNFNLESKYGDGTNIDDQTLEETDYTYLENLLDINYSYNSLFFYTQLEYSNPPIYGYSRTVAKDMFNTYIAEYSSNQFILKYGHLQTLNGYGLTLNMFQDQVTDFDNRIKGLEFKYTPNELMEFFYVNGSGKYGIKSTGTQRSNNLMFDHDLSFYGAQFYTDFGDISISYADKKTKYAAGILNNYEINQPFMSADTRLSKDLQSFQLEGFSNFNMLADSDTEVKLNSVNLGYSNTLSIFDIYYEKSINRYNKILRENDFEDGYYDYLSIASSVLGVDFLYEFKDYNMLYYMPISSNPPLGFMETTSILLSRNQHAIDFSDEIGHQLETRFYINDIAFLMNLSMGMKHYGVEYSEFDFDTFELIEGTYSKVYWSDLITMDFSNKNFVYHKPFRNFYTEASGWSSNDRFYYKFGYASSFSYDDVSAKNYQSFTIPTQFVYAFKSNNSLTIYYEYQKLNNLSIKNPTNWNDYYNSKKYSNNYLSISYNLSHIGSISYFYDSESYDQFLYTDETVNFLSSDSNKWIGLELSLELSSSVQLSVFHGSQKGGLVCANGICAVQPSFEDGTKVTLRALF